MAGCAEFPHDFELYRRRTNVFFLHKTISFLVVLLSIDLYNVRARAHAHTHTHIKYISYSVSAIVWSCVCLVQLNAEIIVDACTHVIVAMYVRLVLLLC